MTIVAPGDLAVEGKTVIRVHNSCHGKFGGGPCDESPVREVKELEVADPTIASLKPIGGKNGRTEFELTGLRPGKTTLRARATFANGEEHQTTTDLHVIAIDRIEIAFWSCREGVLPNLVPLGEISRFDAIAYGNGRILAGKVPNLVVAEGVTQLSPDAPYVFQAPSSEAKLPLESRFVDDIGIVFDVFGPERITRIDVETPDPEEVANGRFTLGVVPFVNDRIPCLSGVISVTTATPAVCASIEGETTWQADDSGFLMRTTSNGSCRLSFSPVGGSLTQEFEFPVALREP